MFRSTFGAKPRRVREQLIAADVLLARLLKTFDVKSNLVDITLTLQITGAPVPAVCSVHITSHPHSRYVKYLTEFQRGISNGAIDTSERARAATWTSTRFHALHQSRPPNLPDFPSFFHISPLLTFPACERAAHADSLSTHDFLPGS